MRKQRNKEEAIKQLQGIRNIIVVTAENLYSIGITSPEQLIQSTPKQVYENLKVKRRRLIYITRFFQLIVYSIAIILILWTLNIDVTGLVAGLGIGGVVMGFALKEIIENWVSGLIIISGKIYQIGDVITVNDLTGVVSDINLKTTSRPSFAVN